MDFIEYAGRRFWLQSSGRYFQSGVKTDTERLLHRRIWADAHGPIPDGHDVHHKDGDWRNNVLENLECLPTRVHRSAHTKELWQRPETEAAMRAGLAKAQVAAPAWHASQEGREWHAKNALAAWENRKWHPATCVVCKAEYETPFPDRAMYCTKACENKAAHAKYRETRKCVQCGEEFSAFKFAPYECCSRTCGNRRKRGHPPTDGKPPVLPRIEREKTSVATCQLCGTEFKYDRWAKNIPRTCSPKCRGALRKVENAARTDR